MSGKSFQSFVVPFSLLPETEAASEQGFHQYAPRDLNEVFVLGEQWPECLSLRSVCRSCAAGRNVGQALLQNCTVISPWSWRAARSGLPELWLAHRVLRGCSATTRFRSISTCRLPLPADAGHSRGRDLRRLRSLFDALPIRVPRKRCFLQISASLSTCLLCLPRCSPCSPPVLPFFSPPFSPTLPTRQPVLLVEKLFLPLKLHRN